MAEHPEIAALYDRIDALQEQMDAIALRNAELENALRDTLKAGYELAHPLWAIGGHQERVDKWNVTMDNGYTLIGKVRR